MPDSASLEGSYRPIADTPYGKVTNSFRGPSAISERKRCRDRGGYQAPGCQSDEQHGDEKPAGIVRNAVTRGIGIQLATRWRRKVPGPCDDPYHRQQRDQIGQTEGMNSAATTLTEREGQPNR